MSEETKPKPSLPVQFRNYKMITGKYPDYITDEVNEHLARGAILIGGMMIGGAGSDHGFQIHYGQAIAYPI